MAGHFGAIGFAVTTREELEALGVLAASMGEPHDAGSQRYLRWSVGAGVELWAQAETTSRTIKGVHPYFASGKAALEATIEEVTPSPKRAHDGAITVIPGSEAARAALAGVAVTLPDFQLVRDRLQPRAPVRLSVAAFAHAFEELRSERELGAAGLGPGMMLPAPQGLVLAAGRVLEAERRRNGSTGRELGWLLLAVEGGTIDVLVDPELGEDLPAKGQAVRGVFWLAGRLS
jgi:hypothetical protein